MNPPSDDNEVCSSNANNDESSRSSSPNYYNYITVEDGAHYYNANELIQNQTEIKFPTLVVGAIVVLLCISTSMDVAHEFQFPAIYTIIACIALLLLIAAIKIAHDYGIWKRNAIVLSALVAVVLAAVIKYGMLRSSDPSNTHQ